MENFKDSKITEFSNKAKLSGKGSLIEIPKNPKKGFNFGYLLFVPENISDCTSLIVEGANPQSVFESIEEAEEEIKDLIKTFGYLIFDWNKETNFPILVPMFPKIFKNNKTTYTNMLTSGTLNLTDELFKRLDKQLINMIADAKERMGKNDIYVDEKIIINGFSGSSKFANRFTILHPEMVKLCIGGAVTGCLTLPIKQLNNEKLIFPIGVGDLPEIDDKKIDDFLKVQQFYYMGLDDTNDPFTSISENNFAPRYNETMKEEEIKQLYTILGRNATGDRWENTQKIYNQLGVNVTFESYQNEGHRPHLASEKATELLKSQIITKTKNK